MSKKIILLDLNYTLIDPESSKKITAPFTKAKVRERMRNERVRLDLVKWIRGHHVLLITARPIEYEELTLDLIAEQASWSPEETYFLEDRDLDPPRHKEKMLIERIYPVHGSDPSLYTAIESNARTRAMYKRQRIAAVRYEEIRDQCEIRNLVLGTDL